MVMPPDAPSERWKTNVLGRARAYIASLVDGAELPPARPVPHEAAVVSAVVALGVTLRFLGLRLGLPYFHHWDEVLITSSARGMLERGDDVPSTFFYGAPVMRLTAIAFRWGAWLHVPGIAGAPLGDEVALRWAGRSVTATMAASGTLAVYLGARFTVGPGAGAIAAALAYAVAAELVWHARYLVTDASVVALTAWTFALSAAYAERRMLWLGALAVMFSGLTFAFKLTGLATILLPLGVLLLRPPRGAWRTGDLEMRPRLQGILHRALLLGAVPIMVWFFLFFNPHVRDHWQRAFSDWEGIARHYRQGHAKPFAEREAGWDHLTSALWYLAAEAFQVTRWVSLAFSIPALIGLVCAVRRASLPVILGAVHAAAVVVTMAWPNRAYLTRMYLPALPVLCIGFGFAVAVASTALERVAGGRVRMAALAAVAVLMSAPSGWQAIACQRQSVDARIRGLDWVALRSKELGREVTVAFSPGVAGGIAVGSHGAIRNYLRRPGVRVLDDVSEGVAARESGADFLLSASFRDLKKTWPYQEQWSFREVPGYLPAVEFPSNPYEERYDQQPTWDGHVSALVLERIAP
jgi:hypothetical protein